MTDERYEKLVKQEGAIELGHPDFDHYIHTEDWGKFPVTVVVCNYKTKIETQLCIESLLRFYPDIKILCVDNDSADDSTLYLRYKALTTPNLTLWERKGNNPSHGDTMNEVIIEKVDTEYVLFLDSDTITMRGGWIREMYTMAKYNNVYAIGHLMLVTEKGEAIGPPWDEDDVLRYIHPSCGMYHVPTYKTLFRFSDHGAPGALNMIEAKHKGLQVWAYPIDKYVCHLMGKSWVKEHDIIWRDDYDVFVRPFITFITGWEEYFMELEQQTDKDFDCVLFGKPKPVRIWIDKDVDVNNLYYQIRHNLLGEYVCVLSSESELPDDFVHQAKRAIIESGATDEITVCGFHLVKRQLFQKRECIS